jgi:hypothetical protein
MGNWIVSPAQKEQKDKEREQQFNQKIYQDIAFARQLTENDIKETEAEVLNGVISRAYGDECIANLKKQQLEFESDMIKIIETL